jgi:hypothetical protein
MISKFRLAVASLALTSACAVAAQAAELPANDYPTIARADYVFACMQVNGQTREALEKCSCSIDQIAAVLPWSEYEETETIMSVSQRGGESVSWSLQPKLDRKSVV